MEEISNLFKTQKLILAHFWHILDQRWALILLLVTATHIILWIQTARRGCFRIRYILTHIKDRDGAPSKPFVSSAVQNFQ